MHLPAKTLWMMSALLLVTGFGLAQMKTAPHGFMEAVDATMKRMAHDMAAVPMSGNVDRDFAQMMIPHHQGAIDMAKTELRYGKDPVMFRLAQEIIVDQQSEIEAMQLRLAKMKPDSKEAK